MGPKRAYLFGVGNVLQSERAMTGAGIGAAVGAVAGGIVGNIKSRERVTRDNQSQEIVIRAEQSMLSFIGLATNAQQPCVKR